MTIDTNARGIVLDFDSCKAERSLKATESKFSNLEFANSLEQANRIVASETFDFMIIHERPNTFGLDLVEKFRQMAPTMPMILLCEAASGTWAQQLTDPRLELVYSAAPPQELEHRIAKLLNLEEQHFLPENRIAVEPIPMLRSTSSGRLDAERIAECFGLTLKDIARAANRPYTTVHKTPDSLALQPALYPFERIASAIKTITGGALQKGLKIWLNSPNKAFPKALPVELIKQGHASLLADLLEDHLLGQPG
ncbi:MAG: hypothetical protein WC028_23165 [Candidatus Obscuribacterales bacterium]|jgi:ActR/RegA family two-component response regulator